MNPSIFGFKNRQMSLKEEPREKMLSSPFIFWRKKDFLLNRVQNLVFYVKKVFNLNHNGYLRINLKILM